MDNKTYQEEASKTIPNEEIYTKTLAFNNDKKIINAALGLAGETGELVDVLKKAYFQGHELDRDEIIKETGDVFWYLNLLCQALNITFDEVMEANIVKLRKRYGEHFDSNKSRNREEYQTKN